MTTLLTVELHCHTYHSSDSLMLPQDILLACDRRGIDRVAITDHNSMAGAFEAHALDPGRVILGEEILTMEGEILGYFMTEEIPEGLHPLEVVERLKEQRAVISISHPFDPTRGCRWSRETLMALSPYIDAIEVLNARCWSARPNDEAVVFAHQANLYGTAGSDAHAPSEVGRAFLQLPFFSDAETFRSALAKAQVMGRRSIPLVHLFSRYATWRKALGWTPPQRFTA